MHRAGKAGAVLASAAVALSFGIVLVRASPAAGDTEDHYKPANTQITGTATGTPTGCPTTGRPTGTFTCFSVPGKAPTLTVYCKHSTSGAHTPATGLGLMNVSPLVVFDDGGSPPKPCTDSLGGNDTTKVQGVWKIGGLDRANDETGTGSTEPNTGDRAEVVVPQHGAIVTTSQGCQITVAPSGPYTAIGTYDDHSKFIVNVTNVPVVVSKLKTSCPLPAAVTIMSTFSATYIFNPPLSDAS